MLVGGRVLERLVLEGLPLSDLDFRWRVVMLGVLWLFSLVFPWCICGVSVRVLALYWSGRRIGWVMGPFVCVVLLSGVDLV